MSAPADASWIPAIPPAATVLRPTATARTSWSSRSRGEASRTGTEPVTTADADVGLHRVAEVAQLVDVAAHGQVVMLSLFASSGPVHSCRICSRDNRRSRRADVSNMQQSCPRGRTITVRNRRGDESARIGRVVQPLAVRGIVAELRGQGAEFGT